MGTRSLCGEGLRSNPGDDDLRLRLDFCGRFRLGVDLLNEALQLDGALLAHLLADVAVDVQREGRRGVAEVFLEGFEIHTAFQTDHRVGVPLRYNNDKPEESRIFKGFQGFKPDF